MDLRRLKSSEQLRQLLKHEHQPDLRVSMLGPRGVGKTSLLASMWEQMESVVSKTHLQLTPDLSDAQTLHDKVVQLRKLFDKEGLQPDWSAGISSTADWRAFDFGIGRRGKNASMRLQFVDYPGGWINEEGRLHRPWVQDLLARSDSILIPIDTPALMDRKGHWHVQRNQPDFIYQLIQASYEELTRPRLVILCPIRCELYFKEAVEKRLGERVQEGYELLLSHLANDTLRNLVAVVICPVQTVGEIVYEGSPKEQYLPVFTKTQPDATYSPRDNEQPLRYVLRFAMRLQKEEREQGIMGVLRKLLGTDEYLWEAAKSFAAGCRDDIPYSVIQGHDLLDVEEAK